MRQDVLFVLWDWKHKRYMHVLMTTSSIVVRSMKMWMPVRYAKCVGIRSLEMIQAMLRDAYQEESACQGDVEVECLPGYNTTFETSINE
jgi:hypothetical protein